VTKDFVSLVTSIKKGRRIVAKNMKDNIEKFSLLLL